MSFQSSMLAHSLPIKRVTKKQKFLEEMEAVIPWHTYMKIIDQHWRSNTSHGRPRTDGLLLLRITFLQQWYNLSDEWVEDEVYNQIIFQKFLDLNLTTETVPDSTTIENFRHMLEERDLWKKIFEETNEYLTRKWLILKEGTVADATLIKAPSSTKNKQKKRDPEMSSTKKNNNYHFGMKMHAGVDSRSRCIHTMRTTTAKVHDSIELDDLLHGDEGAVFADKAYASKERKQEYRKKWVYYGITDKAARWKKLSLSQKKHNRRKSTVRSRWEHPFHVIKNIFGYKKVRYRWLKKNTDQLYLLASLSNVYMTRNKLLSW